MSQLELAKRMARPYKVVSEIIKGKKAITAGTALDIEGALGIPARFWLNLEQAYQLARARQRRQRIASA